MTPDEWKRIKDIAAEALALAPDERAAFVAGRCGGDAALRADVQSLLESSDAAAGLYETPLVSTAEILEAARTADESSMAGRRIGAYRVVAGIGQGGMGAAYLAERADEAFEKRVVIKLIKRGMDTDAILRRFRHERQILANLDHPNIATLLDGGTTGDGRPYFVMEHVDGLPIDVYCDRLRLPIEARLRLFVTVCEAVQHAHEMRVIHRDLKPGNILVTRKGVPKLLDFGIAKLLDAEGPHATEDTLLTGAMTPLYASPEQIQRGPITPASDVYSLGVLLFTLLAGRHPHVAGDRSRQQIEEAVCLDPPTRPSRAVDAGASELRSVAAEHLRRELSGNLDAIALMALRKEPGRRYASARELADDVARHLDGRPILARPEGAGARVRRLLTGSGAAGTAARSRRAVSRRLLAAAGLLVVLVAGLTAAIARRGSAPPPAPFDSLAVLPFANAGGDPALDYLSDGITEHLIARLSAMPRLRVIARDSAFRYRRTRGDPAAIGRELAVGAVLTGSVAQRGADLAVTARLIDAADGRRIWSSRYERRLNDVQLLESELAADIAGGLRLPLTGEVRSRFTQAYTGSAEAYQLYLKGRYFWNRRTPADLRRSVEFFREAARADPQFALAWAGLADSNGLLTEYHVVPALETYPEAKRAAERALALDPLLGEAHTSLAYVRQFYEWEFTAAEHAYRRAIELNPDYPTAHQWYAEFLSSRGRAAEALVEIRRARDDDPVSLIVNAVEANILYMARQHDDAIEQCRRVIDLDPNFPEAYEYLKRIYDQKGLYREAIEARQTRRRLLGRDVTETVALRTAAAATSAPVYWRSRVTQELAESRAEGLQPFEMAELLAQAGEVPRALEWLARACDDNDFQMVYAGVAPNLDPLRSESAFQAILQRRCGVRGR